MSNKSLKKTLFDGLGIVYAFAGLVALVALVILFFDKNDNGHTPMQIILYQGPVYVISKLVTLALAALVTYLGISLYRWSQNFWYLVACLIVAITILAIGIGPAFTDVANDGVTGPKGRPTAYCAPVTGAVRQA